jgi:hypothetical protein
MMVAWRELAGWILLGFGLATFGVCYWVFLLNRRIIEATGMIFIGFVIFRGGLHLLKVAMAARAAAEARAHQSPPVNPRRSATVARSRV